MSYKYFGYALPAEAGEGMAVPFHFIPARKLLIRCGAPTLFVAISHDSSQGAEHRDIIPTFVSCRTKQLKASTAKFLDLVHEGTNQGLD